MSRAPIWITAILVGTTVGLVRVADIHPSVAALLTGAAALSVIVVTTGIALILLPNDRRRDFLRGAWSTARQDLADLFSILTFRR